jgi:hypothetical protein
MNPLPVFSKHGQELSNGEYEIGAVSILRVSRAAENGFGEKI